MKVICLKYTNCFKNMKNLIVLHIRSSANNHYIYIFFVKNKVLHNEKYPAKFIVNVKLKLKSSLYYLYNNYYGEGYHYNSNTWKKFSKEIKCQRKFKIFK